MTEAELYVLLVATLDAGFAARSAAFPTPPDVRQANQPRVIGTLTDPCVLLSNLHSKRYGFLRRNDEWVNPYPPYPDGAMVHTETQAIEATFQCGALVPAPPPPGALSAFTAGDLVATAAAILQSDAGLAQLRAGGAGIERVMDIRQPTFTDDMDQFEASPSFDFVLTFNRVDVTIDPVIDAKELKIVAV